MATQTEGMGQQEVQQTALPMQLEEVDFIIREEMHMPQIHWEDLLSSTRRVPLEAHPCQLEVLHVLVKPAYGKALLEDSAAEADRGMRVEEAAGTAVVKERQYRQPDAAAAAAGRMMLAILPADTLPLNTHPGTQRSSARLRARLPRDTARGAGLFTLCRPPSARAPTAPPARIRSAQE